MKNRNFVINLVCQLVVFASNMAINFFMTPYILNKLGTEAYGFIGLINNFVSYLSVITVALNSMAGRYITLTYHKGKIKESEEYYSSVFFANIFLSGMVFMLSIILILNVSEWLNVPEILLSDVKSTIMLAGINTIVSLIAVVYGIAAFIKNELYRNSFGQMMAAVVRIIIMVVSFALFEAHMWYYSFAAVLASITTLLIQRHITADLCPNLIIKLNLLRFDKIYEIIKSGVWVSVESFNKILQTGLDLLIANKFVSVSATGVLSVAKTVPSVLTQVTSTITSVFNPELARLYAENKMKELTQEFIFTIKALSLIMIVPLVGFITFGEAFYTLWLPNYSLDDIALIQKLSVLTVLPLLINAYVEGLYYANTLTNKIRGSVLISLGFSICSVLIEVILLKYTLINPLYVIAGTSSIFLMARYIVVTPIYCAHVLKLPINTFYIPLLRAILVSAIVGSAFGMVQRYVCIRSWLNLIVCCILCGIVGYAFVFCVLLNKVEKYKFIYMIKSRRKNAKNSLREK